MSWSLLEAVYSLPLGATTASEQAILAALAYRANEKTELCFPKQETLAEMTHYNRATVSIILNRLRKKGYITWERGGLKGKHGKDGRPLANDYSFNLELIDKKAKKKCAKSDAPVLASTTRQC